MTTPINTDKGHDGHSTEKDSDRPLLYVEKGNSHKKDLDPHRFDCLRYLSYDIEEDPNISFDELMKKAEQLLYDPYYWIRLRDVITY